MTRGEYDAFCASLPNSVHAVQWADASVWKVGQKDPRDKSLHVTIAVAPEQVTFLHAAPSTWQSLIETGLKAARALRALSGGERLSRELADQILIGALFCRRKRGTGWKVW